MSYTPEAVFIQFVTQPDGSVYAVLRADPMPEKDYAITKEDVEANPSLRVAWLMMHALQACDLDVSTPYDTKRPAGATLQ